DSSYYLGLSYVQLEQYDEALVYLEEAIEKTDDFTQIYQSRMVVGYLYVATKRYRLAEFEFQYLLDEGYESSKVYAALGYICFKQGNVPAGIRNLEKAVTLDPENPTALNSLAFIMANEDIRIPVALSYIRRALTRKPQNPAYLDTLGWILFKNGEYHKARQILQKACELAPENIEIKMHYAKVEESIMTGKKP
ncbi:MAG: tetratricopeptide repeat protein, partial [Salinispira sp.]